VSPSQLPRAAARTGKRLPIAVASRILYDVLIGLHEAHEAVDIRRQPLGIVHRDISPQNIVVGVDGVSRVIDFGIAKARSRIATTRAGIIKGKCAYMAPEQVDGQPVDRRCDVFAAGIVLWEALTGKRLFRGDDEFAEMRLVMRAPVPPPSSLNPECGPDVDVVLSHALARPLEERFQTARAFARALEQAIPPAQTRVVGEHVEAICGTELEYRHGRLQAILGEELDKLSPRAPHRTVPPTTALVVETAPVSREATVRLAPPEAPRTVVGPLRVGTLRSVDVAPASTETSVESDIVELPRRSLTPVLVGVTVLSLLVGAAVATVWLSRGPSPATPTPTPTSTSTPTSSPTTPTPTSTPTPTDSTPTPMPPPSAVPHPRPHAQPGTPPPELKSNPYSH